ncbi:TonB-dependent receptor [Leptospira sp. GIMC2001]|uniref:TonB-dependent receptor n=1 Tax=Leptospira sp. GIMC2001 TaxID=1513297 RepID=UPI002349A25C|nr:TonB-dependent receptor [Leptospira sp. GIMC2001]WCL49258.1 TonB-dependent receptor [Leptospira sp. GIMC2001]
MKTFRTKLIIAIVVGLLPSLLFAQATGSLRGTIIDSENGEAVFGATVVIRSVNKFAKSDFDGKYNVALPPGNYEVEYQMYGYGPQIRKVTIASGQAQSVNITFGAQVLQTVEVSDRALNNTDSALLALQKKSATVSDGISAEAIKKSPDSSASEVMKRVTGVTLVGGKFVFVRGLGERYSSTFLNDAFIPSTEPDKRVVPLDIFPASLLKNIRVIKTFVPEESAEFSGGLVKIETKEYPDQFTMTAGLGIGMNYNTTNRKFLSPPQKGDFFGRPTSSQELPSIVQSVPDVLPFEPGNRFGGLPPQLTNLGAVTFPQAWTPKESKAPYDKNFNFTVGNTFKTTESGQRLGLIFGTVHQKDYRFKKIKDVRYVPVTPLGVSDPRVSSVTPLQEQDSDVYLEETLWGNNLNLAYEFTNGQQLYWKNLYTVQSESQVREFRGVNNIDNFEFFSTASEFTSKELLNSTFGGNHALNIPGLSRPHKLEWQYNYAEANRDQPNLQQQVWRRSNPAPATQIPTRLGNNPDGSRFYSNAEDTIRSGSLKYEIPFDQWDGLKSTFKFGGSVLDREKTFRFREFGSKSNIGVRPTDSYLVPGEVVYNPAEYLQADPLTRLNNKTFSERQVEPNAYDAFQKLQAYFSQVDLPIFSGLRFIGGARYEDSYQKVRTFVLKEQYNGARPTYSCDDRNAQVRIALINSNVCSNDNNGIGELRTRDLLPSANFVWEFIKDQNLRFGYSETLTRPDFREMSPFAFTPYFGADRIRGNSNLQRTYIHNYDFRWEWYATATNYIGVGIFLKDLSNPIETIGQPVAGQVSPFFTYANANKATLRGVEFDFRTDLGRHFRFETNIYFIKSEVNVLDYAQFSLGKLGLLDLNDRAFVYDPTNLKRPLQGQSEFVANLKFDYYLTRKKNSTIGIYYNYFGDRIYVVGANGTPDAYERGVGLTDIVYTYKHEERMDFKFAARNVLDTRFRIYVKDEIFGEERLFRAYREGVSFSMSASYKFY